MAKAVLLDKPFVFLLGSAWKKHGMTEASIHLVKQLFFVRSATSKVRAAEHRARVVNCEHNDRHRQNKYAAVHASHMSRYDMNGSTQQ